MRIDLRIPIVIAAFYTPGLIFLIGAWLLGYSTEEARDFVAFLGGVLGILILLVLTAYLFLEEGPIWWKIPGTKGDSE